MKLDQETVYAALTEVVDPEIGCNIVDLGLVYGVRIERGRVVVDMSLTTPGCPMHECLRAGVRTCLERVPGVEAVEVNLVWDPPWTPDRMNDRARSALAG